MEEHHLTKFLKNPKRALLRLSAPIVVAMLVQTLYSIVDTAWVGRLGPSAIAALTFTYPIYFIIIAINSGISSGMGSRIARFIGEKKQKAAENTAVHGLIIAIAAAIVFFAVFFPLQKQLFYIFGAEQSVIALAKSYLSIILMGIFIMLPAYVLDEIFVSQGDTKTSMKVQVTGLVTNMVLDPIFIYVFKLGVAGAAIATNISIFLTLILYIYYLRKASLLKVNFKCFKFSFGILKEILSVGSPASFMLLIISGYIIIINHFMSHYGTAYVATFGIVNELESIATMPVLALSIAMLTMVGMFFGARKYRIMKDVSWFGIIVGVSYSSLIGIILFIVPSLFIRIFTNDLSLIAITIPYLRLDILTFPLMAIVMCVTRIMQGMGYGLPSFIITLVRIVGVAVPLGYVFVFVLGYSYLYVPVAMVLAGLAASALSLFWFRLRIRKTEG